MKKLRLTVHKTDHSTNTDSRWHKHSLPLKWIPPLLGVGIVAVGIGVWAAAQSLPQPDPIKARLGEPDESPEKRAERELSRLAILEPAAFAAEIAKHKTPQDRLNEQIAIFNISQPNAYAAEFEKFKDSERRQKEQEARAAVLDPVTHSGSVEELKAAVRQKKERGEPIDEILDPKFMSRNIPTKPAVKVPKPIRKPEPGGP